MTSHRLWAAVASTCSLVVLHRAMRGLRLTRDRLGIPALWAEDMATAMYSQGAIHARLRPLQTLLAHGAAAGVLAECIAPLPLLRRLDATARRLELTALSERAYETLDATTRTWLCAYVKGFDETLVTRGAPALVRALRLTLPSPTPAGVLRLLLLMSYLGQIEGQARMELALVALDGAGAQPRLLQALFGALYAPSALAQTRSCLPAGAAHRRLEALLTRGPVAPMGSNAWAAHGSRTASGHPLLAADPHLSVGELPGVLCEMRARIGRDFWLGATLPGLPGLFVGRNRTTAFSGTFAFADTVDWRVAADPDGTPQLTMHWPGAQGLAESLAAYLRLPLAQSAEEAATLIGQTQTLSLSFVVADRFGTVLKKQAGAACVRAESNLGLTPTMAAEPFDATARVPLPKQHACAAQPFVVSANEGDVPHSQVGVIGWSLPQPSYRHERIAMLLAQTRHHTPASFAAMQNDLQSLQGDRLGPKLVALMQPCAVRRALADWDGRMDVNSVGAHAFSMAYETAVRALAPVLGAAAWLELCAHTELPLWWSRALDQLLLRALTSSCAAENFCLSDVRQLVAAALRGLMQQQPQRWGEVHRLTQRHALLGSMLGAGRRSRPWGGSLATVAQASLLPTPQGTMAIGAAYRFVTCLGEDHMASTLPGGQSERPWSPSYTCHLEEYASGKLHPLLAPRQDEALWH